MKNSERVSFAVCGMLIGGIAVSLLVLLCRGLGVPPYEWFAVLAFGILVSGAVSGWAYAAQIVDWLDR